MVSLVPVVVMVVNLLVVVAVYLEVSGVVDTVVVAVVQVWVGVSNLVCPWHEW